MAISTLGSEQLTGKKALLRVDYNVPIKDGVIQDDTRITASLPTINHLVSNQASVIILTHLGRPNGSNHDVLSVEPIADHLSKLLNRPVTFINSCTGDHVKSAIDQLAPGDVLMLENIRFNPEETNNDDTFSKIIASYGDLFVQDAFGAVHRAHSSTAGIPKFLPAFSGLLLEKECHFLGGILENPQTPFVAIIGGSKISTKLPVLRQLLGKVDYLIVGGAMVYTLLKAQGKSIGKSLCEDDQIDEAQSFLNAAKDSSTQVFLPTDHISANDFGNPTDIVTSAIDTIDPNYMGLDIGPDSIEKIRPILESAQTILWNGPVGVSENEHFAKGTHAIATMLANSSATTVVGGGDSINALRQMKLDSKMTHISTGGGASLEFIEGKVLPGILALQENQHDLV